MGLLPFCLYKYFLLTIMVGSTSAVFLSPVKSAGSFSRTAACNRAYNHGGTNNLQN